MMFLNDVPSAAAQEHGRIKCESNMNAIISWAHNSDRLTSVGPEMQNKLLQYLQHQ